ncbi:MAG: topology modulation protein [Firmicutes bacterium]|nr:topology modulation protein [Bacillota bacterium]
MQRILVMGVSSGVGKSTFARRLGESLKLPVYHLDTLFWNPGWLESSPEEFRARQAALTIHDAWIIEGNYTQTYELRAERADTIIYLELPLALCIFRVVRRWLTNLGRTRPDMGEGCLEKLDWAFLSFIITTYHNRKRTMVKTLAQFEAKSPQNRAIHLRGRRAIKKYLQKIQA